VLFGAPTLVEVGVPLAASLAPWEWIFRVTVVGSVVVFLLSWEWIFLDSFRQVIGFALWQLAASVLISCADRRDTLPHRPGRGEPARDVAQRPQLVEEFGVMATTSTNE
jgi:hypothetical protein